MKINIPYGKHSIDQSDINAVIKNLKSNSITQGPQIEKFENAIREYVNCKYAVAVSSCTAGMHLALLSVGFKEKDKLLTSPLSFVSSANVGRKCGGEVDFVDIDLKTLNFSLDIFKSQYSKKRFKALIPVHFSGNAMDMSKLKKIVKNRSYIIEDAAHAFGARYKDGTMVGSCKYSDATVFSFHPVKTIACGEGGLITTNNKSIYKKLLRLRSHGINKKDDKFINKKNAFTKKLINPWYYEMQELGYHYRMTEIQASLGISQLKKINKFLKRRREIANYYKKQFSLDSCNFTVSHNYNITKSSNHLFIINLNLKKIKKSRAQIMVELKKRGIQTQVHYIPIPMHPYYQRLKYNENCYKNAKKYYQSCLSIPIFYNLNLKTQKYVIKNLYNIIK